MSFYSHQKFIATAHLTRFACEFTWFGRKGFRSLQRKMLIFQHQPNPKFNGSLEWFVGNLPCAKSGCTILDRRGDFFRIHFTCKCINSSQIHWRHVCELPVDCLLFSIAQVMTNVNWCFWIGLFNCQFLLRRSLCKQTEQKGVNTHEIRTQHSHAHWPNWYQFLCNFNLRDTSKLSSQSVGFYCLHKLILVHDNWMKMSNWIHNVCVCVGHRSIK